jgi:hypothetical protein
MSALSVETINRHTPQGPPSQPPDCAQKEEYPEDQILGRKYDGFDVTKQNPHKSAYQRERLNGSSSITPSRTFGGSARGGGLP